MREGFAGPTAALSSLMESLAALQWAVGRLWVSSQTPHGLTVGHAAGRAQLPPGPSVGEEKRMESLHPDPGQGLGRVTGFPDRCVSDTAWVTPGQTFSGSHLLHPQGTADWEPMGPFWLIDLLCLARKELFFF